MKANPIIEDADSLTVYAPSRVPNSGKVVVPLEVAQENADGGGGVRQSKVAWKPSC